MNKEYNSYKSLLDQIDDVILKKRAEGSLEYYIKKATLYKRLWTWLSAAGIVLPALATFIVSTQPEKWNCIVALITVCTSIASGFLALFKCADKKTSYRNSAENLKSELCAYGSMQGIYSKNPCNKNSILFERLESIITDGYEKIKTLENEKNNCEI